MPRTSLTGSRIRERRIMQGLRQTDLAREVGISPSYLNLIEHNRRRIGGKLLLDIAGFLQIEPTLLIEGAEAALISVLREAAAALTDSAAETDRADEFAGRFPGWAQLLADAHRRVIELEHTVETLTDRLAHDPHLAASLHEVLSTVTAIRSTSAILVETKELEPEWRDRFHRNLNEDSKRLADGAQSLVSYLDTSQDAEMKVASPLEEVETFLSANNYHFPELEEGGGANPEDCLSAQSPEEIAASRDLTLEILEEYKEDAHKMPLVETLGLIAEEGPDPALVAARFGVDLASALRRLASLPAQEGVPAMGLVVCDASGTLIFRKMTEGFAVPRFGAACPLWPLYTALRRPLAPIRASLQQVGRNAGTFTTFSIAQPVGPVTFNRDPLVRSYMLIVPAAEPEGDPSGWQQVGSSCRVCPRASCDGRREPSII